MQVAAEGTVPADRERLETALGEREWFAGDFSIADIAMVSMLRIGGADLLAMSIRDTAKTSKVPVLQAPVLARALYAHAEIDREIPAALFAAVAQVLAYVYQLRAALAGHSPMPGELPELNVPAELDPHNKMENAE